MHMLFVDESGTPPKPEATHPRYFVVGGIIIPEGAWHRVRDALMGLKIRHGVRGEIKWRYFAPGNNDPKNPLKRLDQAKKDEVRSDVYRAICSDSSVRSLASVCCAEAAYNMHSVNTQENLYHLSYKSVSERFQYHLQDLSRTIGRKEYGIIVGDHRGQRDDKRLRGHHQNLLHSTGEFVSTYKNFIEGLFLEPSHLSVGIQLADLIAGAVWRKYERGDDRWYALMEPSLRRGPNGEVEGFGIVKTPKRDWR
jgi:hypothetical protein